MKKTIVCAGFTYLCIYVQGMNIPDAKSKIDEANLCNFTLHEEITVISSEFPNNLIDPLHECFLMLKKAIIRDEKTE